MKLLKEYYSLETNEDILNEYKKCVSEGKPLILRGIIQRADTKNQNGRIYPKNILKKECDRYTEEFIKRGVSLGELDHRDTPVVELKNVSHLVEDISWDGNDVIGTVRILNTPAGNIAKELVLSGIPLGISSRGIGSVSKSESMNGDVVQEDLSLISFDLVSHPSTAGAFLQEKIYEGLEIKNFNPNKVLPAELRIKQTLDELLKKK